MHNLAQIQADLKITFIALINQRQLKEKGMNIPVKINWPEPHLRKTINQNTQAQFSLWFRDIFPTLPEVLPFFPTTEYRYEVAISGTNNGVHDLKISPILRGGSGPTIFNYHVLVVTV
jgi:hypothetical protein